MNRRQNPAVPDSAPMHWVKLWRSESSSFSQLPLVARGIAAELLKICDRDGRIFVGAKKPWDAVAFALGADRNDRRALRSAIPLLLSDGYLVGEGEWIRVRNFRKRQGIEGAKPTTNEPRTNHEPTTNEPRTNHDGSDKPAESLDRVPQDKIRKEKRREDDDSASSSVSELPRRDTGHGPRQPDHAAADAAIAKAFDPDAEIRSALVVGYRDAFGAKFGALPGDVRGSDADGAVFAIQHRAGVTGQDPVAIAAHAARNWLESRDPWDGNPRKLPRWKYFLEDIGTVLVMVEPAEAAQ